MLSIFFTILFYDDQNIRIVKLDSNLEVEWTEEYGECDGSDQLFDFVVDRLVAKKYKQRGQNFSNGDIVTGGHTVAGVINWDYLALKVNIFVYIYTIQPT